MSKNHFITTEKRGNIFLICFNRAEARNAVNTEMLIQISDAFTEYENDPSLRCAVIYANGLHFTFGLELENVASTLLDRGTISFPENNIDPWDIGITKRARTKPVICAVHGFCLTLGIELMLAADIVIAAEKTKFAQMEVQRGLMPFGGATIRFVRSAGWGNAMRYLLTGDDFGVEEAFRMGLIQEIVPKKELLNRALELAVKISEQAPLAVKAVLASSRKFVSEGEKEAVKDFIPVTLTLMESEDGKEGVRAFVEKRKPNYTGK